MKLRVLSRFFSHPLCRRKVCENASWSAACSSVQHAVSFNDAFGDSSYDFENPIVAFQNKSFWEVSRALGILLICGCDRFVDNSQKLMTFSQMILGKRLFRTAIKPTFYSQFVGGETPEEIMKCMKSLTEAGVQPLLASTLEDDHGGKKEEVYDRNTERILESITMTSDRSKGDDIPMAQLKITGLLPADLLITISKIFSSSNRKEKLVEAVACGMTGKTRMSAFESELCPMEQDTLNSGISRLREIAEVAEEKKVKLLVDAEYTYLNHALSLLTLAMMASFNAKSPLIWNTYQCYLKKAMENLKLEMSLASKFGVCFGAKIVRGAYIIQETQYAIQHGYANPVCNSYEETNDNYNWVLNYVLEHISNVGPKCNIIIASHNEDSIKFAIQRMKKLNIDAKLGGVHFGQLYGMCDQITYPLASMGYSVYKSIPYGTIEEVLPYLARRANENRSVLAGSRKEKQLLWKNLKLRMFNPNNFDQTRIQPGSM